MVKYATYSIFKNKNTGEIKRIPFKDDVQENMIKEGHANSEWVELGEEPDESQN